MTEVRLISFQINPLTNTIVLKLSDNRISDCGLAVFMSSFGYKNEAEVKVQDFTIVSDDKRFVLTRSSRVRGFATRQPTKTMTWTAVKDSVFYLTDNDGNLRIGKPDGLDCAQFLKEDATYENCLARTKGCRFEIENYILKVYSPDDKRTQYIPTENLQYWKLKDKIEDFKQQINAMGLICDSCHWMISKEKSDAFVAHLQEVIALVQSRSCDCATPTPISSEDKL